MKPGGGSLHHPLLGLDLYLYLSQLPSSKMPGGLSAPGTASYVLLFHADACDQLLPRRGGVRMGPAAKAMLRPARLLLLR